MHKKRAVAAAATTAIALLGAGVGTATAEPTPLTKTGNHRIAGANRYETAVKVSQQSFTTPQAVVFIASGESFADALAAGPLAAAAEAPILLVPKGSLPTVVRNELTRLKPKAIAIVGGTGSISQANMDAIAKYAPAGGTERIFGSNRYATAEQVVSSFDPADIDVVYLASGESFADALGGGAAAAAEAGALLLTAKGGLPAETTRALKYLTPTEVVILGGTGAVSATVASQVKSATGVTPYRHAGEDRFETAAMVAYSLWATTGAKKVFLASGDSFPDALAATPAAYINDAPIMLTRSTCTPMVTDLTRDELAPDLNVFLGGSTISYSGDKVC